MQFVVLGEFNDKYSSMPEAEQQAGMEAECAKSREYYAKGVLRDIWLFQDAPKILSLFEVGSEGDMRALLDDYPGVKQGFVTAEFHRVGPYGGFAPEFQNE